MEPECSANISHLLDEILQHILFFLPIHDAASTSILSKTWLRVWNSLPVFTFTFDQQNLGLTVPEFVNRVNQSLSPLQSNKVVIKEFLVVMNLSVQEHKDFVSDIDDWISWVLRNCVRNLTINVSSPTQIYILPEPIFTSRSLVVVRLYGCKLPETTFEGAQDFKFLKELYLFEVVADDYQVQNLIDSCQSLEKLTLVLDHIVDFLDLDNFLMLHYVFVKGKILRLNAINLLTLEFFGLRELHLSDSTSNIKSLSCSFWSRFTTQNISLQEMLSTFTLLEELNLHLAKSVKSFRIRHCNLKIVHLYGTGKPESPWQVEIDMSCLCQLHCHGDAFPSLSVISPSIKECETLQLYINSLDTDFRDCADIHRLGDFLQNFNQSIEVYLNNICTENLITVEQLQAQNLIHPATKIKKLILSYFVASSDYTSFLDVLLFTCHPSYLLIETCVLNGDPFIKFLCHELLGREENATCCRDNVVQKCWRHFLKGVEVKCYEKLCETEELSCFVSSDLSSTLYMCDTEKSVEFTFEWLE
ncbi:PREDICTED: putative F-box protein At5g40050 [Lupinus angustifolius]|uniref:putative F-box protein At5g40050 n=1 Tax=Lupinus angustifolius TaxID=3871 RepID=UPI00092E4AB8|nr:PREDICTED: putative F-box protein At5g40050 [Lupinus angustifolius]